MKSDPTPRPLRILLALPEPAQTKLRRALTRLRPAIERTAIGPADIKSYLMEAGYYHVLYVSPVHWRALARTVRQQYANRVDLICLVPEPAEATELADMKAALYIPTQVELDEAISTCVDLHNQLAQGALLKDAVAYLQGRLAAVGDLACWSLPENKPTQPTQTESVPDFSAEVRAAGIGVVNVAGDAVQSKTVIHSEQDQIVNVRAEGMNKIVQQAGGSQVNTNRVTGQEVEIAQAAGEDQVNVNRITDASPNLIQTADGDQVNNNRVTPSALHKSCTRCGKEQTAAARFCMNCGNPF